MANEIFTRIQLKYDSYTEWKKVEATFKPLKGEICIVNPATNLADTAKVPCLMKVGDGENFFKDLPWISATAADVYKWAKAADVVFENQHIIFKDAAGVSVKDLDLSDFITTAELATELANYYTKEEIYEFFDGVVNTVTTVAEGTGINVTDAGTNGNHAYTVALDVDGAKTALGLGSAAYTDSDIYVKEDGFEAKVHGAVDTYKVTNTALQLNGTIEDIFTDIFMGDTAVGVAKATEQKVTFVVGGEDIEFNGSTEKKVDVDSAIDGKLANYYTKTEADAEFTTPEEVESIIDTALAEVSGTDAIEGITTLVQYVNEHGTDLAAITKEIYGDSGKVGDDPSRIDTAIADSAQAKSDAAAAVSTANGANTTAGEAKTLAEEAKEAATNATTGAAASASAAAASAAEALASEGAAAQSASQAALSAEAAAGSATTAGEKATAAANSANAAAGSASEAATAKSDAEAAQAAAETAQGLAEHAQEYAETAKADAEAAATRAGNSANAASASETAARASEVAAGNSATAAAGSASGAATSATQAAQAKAAAEAAKGAAETAQAKAEEAQSKAEHAQSYAENAQNAAEAAKSAAATSEANAKTSETNVGNSATAAAGSASAAAKSAEEADASADAALQSKNAAAQSALTAEQQASTATQKANAAAGSATTATEQAAAAAQSATDANAAKEAAVAAKEAAEASNTSATAIANQAKQAAEAATQAADAATQAVAGLHAIATSGSIYDVAEGSNTTVTGAVKYLVFNCGTASTLID